MGNPMAKKGLTKYILLLVVVFVLSGVAGMYLGSALIKSKEHSADDQGKIVSSQRATVMIMGVDSREQDVGRSDTLMLATLDPENDRVSLFSIPRDTRVKIEGYGYDKINAAYAYGGRKLTQATVEELLNTKVDHYVTVNIQGFVKIIDALGGIDINVEKRMVYDDPYDDDGGLHINLYPGEQHMDGKTAITYVRYRDEEGDIGRIRRQQKFMKAVMEKVLSPSIIVKLPSIVSALHDSVKTDMSVSEMISFIMTVKQAKNNQFNAQMLPGKPAYIDDISYWLPDIRKAREMLAADLGVKMDSAINEDLEMDDREYTESIPENTVEITEQERIEKQLEADREAERAYREKIDKDIKKDEKQIKESITREAEEMTPSKDVPQRSGDNNSTKSSSKPAANQAPAATNNSDVPSRDGGDFNKQ